MENKFTLQMAKDLYKEFQEFANKQEQNMFPMLALLDLKMENTIKLAKNEKWLNENQENMRAMFSSIYTVMGKENPYKKEER